MSLVPVNRHWAAWYVFLLHLHLFSFFLGINPFCVCFFFGLRVVFLSDGLIYADIITILCWRKELHFFFPMVEFWEVRMVKCVFWISSLDHVWLRFVSGSFHLKKNKKKVRISSIEMKWEEMGDSPPQRLCQQHFLWRSISIIVVKRALNVFLVLELGKSVLWSLLERALAYDRFNLVVMECI